jgi:GNAT superfamily N-acetyltransferase
VFQIRAAKLQDAVGLARIQVHGWQAAYRGIFPDELLDGFTVEKRSQVFAQRLANPDYPSDREWLCERDGEIIGWLSWGPSRDDDTDPSVVAEVAAVYVHPSAWRMGVGALLLEHIHEHLTQLGTYRETTLWVLEKNPQARRFYERYGYQTDGARKAQPKFPDIMEVRYRRLLDPRSAL